MQPHWPPRASAAASSTREKPAGGAFACCTRRSVPENERTRRAPGLPCRRDDRRVTALVTRPAALDRPARAASAPLLRRDVAAHTDGKARLVPGRPCRRRGLRHARWGVL